MNITTGTLRAVVVALADLYRNVDPVFGRLADDPDGQTATLAGRAEVYRGLNRLNRVAATGEVPLPDCAHPEADAADLYRWGDVRAGWAVVAS